MVSAGRRRDEGDKREADVTRFQLKRIKSSCAIIWTEQAREFNMIKYEKVEKQASRSSLGGSSLHQWRLPFGQQELSQAMWDTEIRDVAQEAGMGVDQLRFHSN
jgi:hypothetical protein